MHPVVLGTGLLALGTGKQRGHPVGEPDRRQGPVRQVVVFDHRVTGREDLVHHHGALRGHRREGALVLLRVNPCYGHRLQATARGVEGEHLLARSDLAGEGGRHPLLLLLGGGVAAHEEEVRGGEGDLLARVRLDHVEEPPGRRVSVYEHDEVGVNRVPVAVRRQDPVPGLEVFDRLRGAILQGDGGGAREAAA